MRIWAAVSNATGRVSRRHRVDERHIACGVLQPLGLLVQRAGGSQAVVVAGLSAQPLMGLVEFAHQMGQGR